MSVRPRLVIWISDTTEVALRACVQAERLNKTTIINRAVQMYAHLSAIERGGGDIYIREPGSTELQRYRWE